MNKRNLMHSLNNTFVPDTINLLNHVLFVKKKDGRLRPVQDYRKLNDMTIRNQYPLPLIQELVNKLKGAKYFTKLNVQWGYNNMWIKEGDKWKAVFLTLNDRMLNNLTDDFTFDTTMLT